MGPGISLGTDVANAGADALSAVAVRLSSQGSCQGRKQEILDNTKSITLREKKTTHTQKNPNQNPTEDELWAGRFLKKPWDCQPRDRLEVVPPVHTLFGGGQALCSLLLLLVKVLWSPKIRQTTWLWEG